MTPNVSILIRKCPVGTAAPSSATNARRLGSFAVAKIGTCTACSSTLTASPSVKVELTLQRFVLRLSIDTTACTHHGRGWTRVCATSATGSQIASSLNVETATSQSVRDADSGVCKIEHEHSSTRRVAGTPVMSSSSPTTDHTEDTTVKEQSFHECFLQHTHTAQYSLSDDILTTFRTDPHLMYLSSRHIYSGPDAERLLGRILIHRICHNESPTSHQVRGFTAVRVWRIMSVPVSAHLRTQNEIIQME